MNRITIFYFLVIMVCLSSCRQDDKNSGHQEDNKNYDQQEDKNSLPNSNITFNVDSIKVHNALNYQALRKKLLAKRNSLNQDKMPFDKYLANSISLYNDKEYSGFSDLQKILKEIPNNFEYYNYKNRVSDLDAILENDTIPKPFKFNILKGFCRQYTRSVKLDSALIYFNLIKELYPSYEDKCINNSFPCVATANHQIDSIRSTNISKDRLVFLEAKIREKMIHCSCWFGDSWYNYSIVQEKYQEILTNHPNSDYADDAEYWMINYRNSDREEGGFSINEIPEIRKFVSKYPNSDLIPELLMNIAYSYSIDYSENLEDRIKQLEKGIEELRTLKNNYSLDSIELKKFEQDLSHYKHKKNNLIYTLTIVPSKSEYKINEEVEVEIIISNNTSTPKTLDLFQNDSYLSIGVHPQKEVRFIPSEKTDSTKKSFEIVKGTPLKQKIKINKLARHWDGEILGRFDFDKEGLFYLTCYSREDKLNSNQAKIYIKK